jgi:ubiquinone/menaquinone biosynthesis C-methylase UbiE
MAACFNDGMPADQRRNVDPAYGDEALAALYDALNTWAPSDDFYLDHILQAASALDVGCGTGELLCRARQAGHTGDLVGVDPAYGMLAAASAKRDDITWLQSYAQALDIGRTFELVTMTGHAFQVLLDDHDTRAALAGFHRHLAPGGRLVFETRNPAARAWERWTPAKTRTTARSPAGEDFDVFYDLRDTREPDLVDFVATYHSEVTGNAYTSASTLRFVDPNHLHSLVTGAGFRIEGWFGDWDRGEVSSASPEVIVVATTS